MSEQIKVCAVCKEQAQSSCSHCKSVWYCGRTCQRAHWKISHKKACKVLQECRIKGRNIQIEDANMLESELLSNISNLSIDETKKAMKDMQEAVDRLKLAQGNAAKAQAEVDRQRQATSAAQTRAAEAKQHADTLEKNVDKNPHQLDEQVVPSYGDEGYWYKRYDEIGEDGATYEWYNTYQDIREVLRESLLGQKSNTEGKYLVVGCGNSLLCEDMHNDGFTDLVGIDISSSVIQQMQGRAKEKSLKGLQYKEMDARHLDFVRGELAGAVDKGTIDAVMSDFSAEDTDSGIDKAKNICRQVMRVLQPGGSFAVISSVPPKHYQKLLSNLCSTEAKAAEVSKNQDGHSIWCYTMTKPTNECLDEAIEGLLTNAKSLVKEQEEAVKDWGMKYQSAAESKQDLSQSTQQQNESDQALDNLKFEQALADYSFAKGVQSQEESAGNMQWSQTTEEVDVFVPIGDPKSLTVTILQNEFVLQKIDDKGELKEVYRATLFREVIPTESNWCIVDDQVLHLSFQKQKGDEVWESLLEGGERIDSSKLTDFRRVAENIRGQNTKTQDVESVLENDESEPETRTAALTVRMQMDKIVINYTLEGGVGRDSDFIAIYSETCADLKNYVDFGYLEQTGTSAGVVKIHIPSPAEYQAASWLCRFCNEKYDVLGSVLVNAAKLVGSDPSGVFCIRQGRRTETECNVVEAKDLESFEGSSVFVEEMKNIRCYQVFIPKDNGNQMIEKVEGLSSPNGKQSKVCSLHVKVRNVNTGNSEEQNLVLHFEVEVDLAQVKIHHEKDTISIRLPFAQTEEVSALESTYFPELANCSIWEQICCRCCKEPLTVKNTFKKILPLPSGDWDESLDYITCSQEVAISLSSTDLSPSQGRCFVGETELLIHPLDVCEDSIRYFENPEGDSETALMILCHQCKTPVGRKVQNENDETPAADSSERSLSGSPGNKEVKCYKLLKHRVLVTNDPNTFVKYYTSTTFLRAQVLRSVNTSGVYRFVIGVKGWKCHPKIRLQVINAKCRTSFGCTQSYCFSCKLTYDIQDFEDQLKDSKQLTEKFQAWSCAKRIYLHHDEWKEVNQKLEEVSNCIPASVCKCFQGSTFTCSYLF